VALVSALVWLSLNKICCQTVAYTAGSSSKFKYGWKSVTSVGPFRFAASSVVVFFSLVIVESWHSDVYVINGKNWPVYNPV